MKKVIALLSIAMLLSTQAHAGIWVAKKPAAGTWARCIYDSDESAKKAGLDPWKAKTYSELMARIQVYNGFVLPLFALCNCQYKGQCPA